MRKIRDLTDFNRKITLIPSKNKILLFCMILTKKTRANSSVLFEHSQVFNANKADGFKVPFFNCNSWLLCRG